MSQKAIKPKQILVADDDQAIIEAITMILEEFGYEVIQTQNASSIYKM
ncbi:MAG: hypothetical protein M3P33_03215 [bacterium]|nr:hypothetical protein [bacterium]